MKFVFLDAEIAQSVEQRPEKPCVASSILALGTIFLLSLPAFCEAILNC
jgi:hypothetical protein